MRTYTNFLIISTCSLEAMIIWTETVILDVNSGYELVSEEKINNIFATNTIMVYFRKRCNNTNQNFFFGVPYWLGLGNFNKTSLHCNTPPLCICTHYLYHLWKWRLSAIKWNEIQYYISKHDLSIIKKNTSTLIKCFE